MRGETASRAGSGTVAVASGDAGSAPAPPVTGGGTGPGHGSGGRARPRLRLGDLAYNYSVLWVLAIEVLIFSLLEPDTFFTTDNAQSILGSQAVLLIIALGLTIPLAVNEFDLSIGAMVVVSQIVMAALVLDNGWALLPAATAGVATCAALGAVNAFFVVRVGVSSFITTLGMSTLALGIAINISNSGPIPGVTEDLVSIASTELLGLQLVFWYGLAATVALWFVLSRTPLGRKMYFTGANPEAARLNGVRTGRLRAGALIASATVAGVAGILYAGVFGTADPNVADDFLLPAFAAAFLGATSVTPGRFNAWGTFFSVYLVITGIVGLTLVTEQVGWISFVFNGSILILAVAAQRAAAVRRERSRRGLAT
jgi:ribose transport system permease protein